MGEQETYLDQYTTINTTSQTTSYSYYVGFSLDDKFGGSFFGNSVQYELKESWTTTWKDSIQTSLTTTSQQTDTAQITGPPCPTTAPPCTPEFAEPHEFSVFQDNLYGTFMYWPNPYFTIGTAPTSTNSGYGSAPASQTVSAGGSTSFSFPSTSNAGYTGTSISFTVTGLPSGASYTPGTVAPGNVFGLDVSTMPSTPKGTYPLTITATDGSQSFLAYATLVVN